MRMMAVEQSHQGGETGGDVPQAAVVLHDVLAVCLLTSCW